MAPSDNVGAPVRIRLPPRWSCARGVTLAWAIDLAARACARAAVYPVLDGSTPRPASRCDPGRMDYCQCTGQGIRSGCRTISPVDPVAAVATAYSSLITYFFFFVFPYWPAGSPFLLKWIWTDVNDHVEYLSRATRDHRYCSGKPLAVRACSPLLDLRFLRKAL